MAKLLLNSMLRSYSQYILAMLSQTNQLKFFSSFRITTFHQLQQMWSGAEIKVNHIIRPLIIETDVGAQVGQKAGELSRN